MRMHRMALLSTEQSVALASRCFDEQQARKKQVVMAPLRSCKAFLESLAFEPGLR